MRHMDVLKISPGIVDIGLIRDEVNELAPYRGPCPEMLPLGENLAATVEQVQASNLATFEPTYTTPVESVLGCSTAPSSLRLTPSAILVPLARVQKVET